MTPPGNVIVAMLLRLEIGALGISNRTADIGETAGHSLLSYIDFLLSEKGIPIHQPRLQNEVPIEFLAGMMTLDEARKVVDFLERREELFKKFLEETKEGPWKKTD